MGSTHANPLARYQAKRDFSVTSEPSGHHAPATKARRAAKAVSEGGYFVIQKHAASRLHYDFRLELDGVLVSWAVPKGPSLDPADKRMAVHVEDHPLSYGSFEGTIPPHQYGAGTVIVWDRGHWAPVGDPRKGLDQGKLAFRLHGEKLQGLWELVRMAKPKEQQEAWLLFKKRDGFARPRSDYDVITALPDSVIAGPLAAPAVATRAKSPSPPKRTKPARKATLPKTLSPQLATLATGVPAEGRWLFELKFDGYRLLARIEGGKVRLITRNNHDWTARMPKVAQAIGRLGLKSGWLDGEIVVLGDHGAPSFSALQNAFGTPRGVVKDEVLYVLFDLPFMDGQDLRGQPLEARRRHLQQLLDAKGRDPLRFSEAFEADAATILQSACQLKMEGVIAKRSDAPYTSARSDSWLKLKCSQRQEFVVCGYTERSDDATRIGSLVLGVHSADGHLLAVGSVGTGWDSAEARALKAQLSPLRTKAPPFAAGAISPGRWTRRAPGSERWVEPKLVAEVRFAEWTAGGQVRQATYVALRSDKAARDIVREVARNMVVKPESSPSAKASHKAVKVTHGDRVIDPETGITKLDLVRYYESVGAWMLPHLKGRPCSLMRAPQGIGHPMFFQKHVGGLKLTGVKSLDPALWPGHEALLEVSSVQGLLNAAQMNVVEFHTWNARGRHIDKPDRMIFDLDPGDGTPWAHVQEAALLVRTMLNELGLASWLKTSGGKGLHVVVPLTPRVDSDTVKAFSKAIVQHLVATIPDRFVVKSGPANRVGKLFVDYLRNGLGATTAAAWSARARPGMGVSVPVDWDELPSLKSGAHWTIHTARDRLSFQHTDPWAAYWTHKQTLSAAMKALGFKAGPPIAK